MLEIADSAPNVPRDQFGDLISGFGDSEAAEGDGGWGQ